MKESHSAQDADVQPEETVLGKIGRLLKRLRR